MADLRARHRIHLVGAGGAGMSGLAKLLAQMGHQVSGSDLRTGPSLQALGDLGLDVWVGSRAETVAGCDLVVASSAVPDDDSELRAAREAGVEVWRRPELLAVLTSEMPALGVSGTHGKTTATALCITALRWSGRDPSFLLGGDLVALGTNGHLGERQLFVLEADEAFGTFLRLRLVGLMVTNVESDHLDHYQTLESLEDAFAEVVGNTQGPVLVGVDDPGGRRLAARTGAVTFGSAENAAWRIRRPELREGSVSFLLTGPSDEVRVRLPRPGLHLARDAAGAVALLAEWGFDPAEAAAGLEEFAGVRRRFEARGRVMGVTMVDDYAHHPTEVAATLEAAHLGDWHRVWAVFQPHRYSRTAALHQEFGPAFRAADRVVICDIYAAGERPVPGVTGRLIAQAVAETGLPEVSYVPHRGELADFLAERVEAGDLVVTMGAGDITLLPDELARRLVAGGPEAGARSDQ